MSDEAGVARIKPECVPLSLPLPMSVYIRVMRASPSGSCTLWRTRPGSGTAASRHSWRRQQVPLPHALSTQYPIALCVTGAGEGEAAEEAEAAPAPHPEKKGGRACPSPLRPAVLAKRMSLHRWHEQEAQAGGCGCVSIPIPCCAWWHVTWLWLWGGSPL